MSEWKKYEYPPEAKTNWNTWHFLSPGGKRLGEVIQVDPTFEVYDAYGFQQDGRIHHGKGFGPTELGRFADFDSAKAAVESFVARERVAL